MLLIREFEQAIHRLFLRGEVHGTTHLSAGQEAVPVGVCIALEPGDYVSGTYRGHGHALAKGTAPEALAAEMLGRASGVCGGRAGLDERGRPRARAGRLLRDRRRIDRRRHRRRADARSARARLGRLLRRRRHQPGLLPRVPQLRRGARAAGRLRLREQPLRRVHADGGGHRRRRDRRPRRRLRHPVRGHRWQRLVGGQRGGQGGGRARAGGRRADAARVPDLPPLRSFEVRPGPVPSGGRGRELAGARPARARARAPAGRRGHGGGLADVEQRTMAELERAIEAARAAPFPDPSERPAREFAA